MRIPKRFKHKGKAWTVKFEKDLTSDGSQCDGLCDLDSRIIYLECALKPRQRKAVFFHELFHAVLHEAHINPGVRFSEGIEEVICDAFSDLVTTSFRNLKWKNNE